MVLGRLDSHMQKKETGPLSYTNINSKLIENVRLETIRLLEENIGGKLSTLVLAVIFLDLIPKSKATKEK